MRLRLSTLVMALQTLETCWFCSADLVCLNAPVSLEANTSQQTLVSSMYTAGMTGSFKCSWIIYTVQSKHAIKFQIAHVFTGSKSSCISDYILVREGSSSKGSPLYAWCKDTPTTVVWTSTTKAIYIELVVQTYESTGIIFIMNYTSIQSNQIMVSPPHYEPVNYVLLGASIAIVLAILVGIGVLVYREVRRQMDAKKQKFKKMLRVRRKGISGISGLVNEQFHFDESASEKDMEDTSFTVVSVTPVSDVGV